MEQIRRFDFRLERNVLPSRYSFNGIKIPVYLPKTFPVFSIPVEDWVCGDWIREVILHGVWEIEGEKFPERVWIKKSFEKLELEIFRKDEKIRVEKVPEKTRVEAGSYKAIITKKREENPFEKVFGRRGEVKCILVLGEIPKYKEFLGYRIEDKFEGKIYEIDIEKDKIRFISGKNVLIVERRFIGEVKLLREVENYIGLRSAEVSKRVLLEIYKMKDIDEAVEFLKRRYLRYLYK